MKRKFPWPFLSCRWYWIIGRIHMVVVHLLFSTNGITIGTCCSNYGFTSDSGLVISSDDPGYLIGFDHRSCPFSMTSHTIILLNWTCPDKADYHSINSSKPDWWHARRCLYQRIVLNSCILLSFMPFSAPWPDAVVTQASTCLEPSVWQVSPNFISSWKRKLYSICSL